MPFFKKVSIHNVLLVWIKTVSYCLSPSMTWKRFALMIINLCNSLSITFLLFKRFHFKMKKLKLPSYSLKWPKNLNITNILNYSKKSNKEKQENPSNLKKCVHFLKKIHPAILGNIEGWILTKFRVVFVWPLQFVVGLFWKRSVQRPAHHDRWET